MKRYFPLLLIVAMLYGVVWAQEREETIHSALQQLIERAEAGDGRALYELAKLHDTGFDSIPKDSIRSTALYRLAALKGYPAAQNFLGFRYYKGEYVARDIDSALYWIQLAADSGDITAAANLGYLLSEGEGITHDFEKAEQWIAVAAEAGVNEAQIKLLEFRGEKWKRLPADSAYNLGFKYYTGVSPILGAFLLEETAADTFPKAKALLGDAYSKGFGVPYNHQKAIDYYYTAAKEGEPSAQFVIAELLEIFPDALNDKTSEPGDSIMDAEFWYRKAARSGITDSETATIRLFSLP